MRNRENKKSLDSKPKTIQNWRSTGVLILRYRKVTKLFKIIRTLGSKNWKNTLILPTFDQIKYQYLGQITAADKLQQATEEFFGSIYLRTMMTKFSTERIWKIVESMWKTMKSIELIQKRIMILRLLPIRIYQLN